MSEKKLLILDDDALIGQTIEAIARSAGFEAQVTTEAERFFEALTAWKPSHIALDLVMPDMDGVEVLVELARREVNAQIIITSGVGNRVLDAAARSATEHGLPIAGVVSKPFSPAVLRDMLNRTSRTDALTSTDAVIPRTSHVSSEGEITSEELQRALDNEELRPVFQPSINCRDSSLAGFETLVRWNSPRRGQVPPGAFIPLAEECGLVGQVTRQVIVAAIRWFSQGMNTASTSGNTSSNQRAQLDRLTLSINLSARSLDDSEFIDYVVNQCETAGIDARRIIFELTETSAMEDPVASLDLLTRLRMKGFQLSIDDFGTGYSSMLQLVRLPFSEIKVDKSFVMSAARSDESRAVIRSIVELGHSLGLRATAEGVEDLDTLEYLKEIRCDLAQGFLISRPLSGDEALAWAMKHLTSWR